MSFVEAMKILLYWVAELDDVNNLDVDVQFHSSKIVVTDKAEQKETLSKKLDVFRVMFNTLTDGRNVINNLFFSKNMGVWTMMFELKFERYVRKAAAR